MTEIPLSPAFIVLGGFILLFIGFYITMGVLCQRMLTRYCRQWEIKRLGMDFTNQIHMANVGLCMGIVRWAEVHEPHRLWLAEMVRTWWLPRLFRKAGLCRTYPFNKDHLDYRGEIHALTIHKNEKRIAFVAKQLKVES